MSIFKSKIYLYLRNHYCLLFLILLIGIILRFANLEDNVFFGFDQARDMHQIYDMVHLKNFKIVGPGTDIPGLFNGPLYLYMLLPGYMLSNFNPNSAAILLILVNLSGILFLYYLGKKLFNPQVGLIAAFLWAVSYEQANFARFISNASPLPIMAILFFLGLYLYFRENKDIGLVISSIALALGISFDFYLIYLGIAYPIFYIIYRPKISVKTLVTATLSFLIISSWFFIAEFKFNFQGSRALFNYFTNHPSNSNPLFLADSFFLYFKSLSQTIRYSFFSMNPTVAGIIFITITIFVSLISKQKKNILFLNIWLLSTAPLFFFRSGVVGGNYIHSTIAGATTLIVALGLFSLFQNKHTKVIGILFILFIFFGNLQFFKQENFISSKILGYQQMIFAEQKNVIDYTYKSSNGEKFSICVLSNPVFVNTLWSTLYKIYGETQYGYLPFWSGPEQNLYKSFLADDRNHQTKRYLIIEPDTGFPPMAKKTTIFKEDQVSVIDGIKRFGKITVQKRHLEKNSEKLKDSQNLSKQEKELVATIAQNDYRYSCSYNY